MLVRSTFWLLALLFASPGFAYDSGTPERAGEIRQQCARPRPRGSHLRTAHSLRRPRARAASYEEVKARVEGSAALREYRDGFLMTKRAAAHATPPPMRPPRCAHEPVPCSAQA